MYHNIKLLNLTIYVIELIVANYQDVITDVAVSNVVKRMDVLHIVKLIAVKSEVVKRIVIKNIVAFL